MKTVMFNPYTGTPRHPSDIASDPSGLLILEPGAPLRAAAAAPAQQAEPWHNPRADKLREALKDVAETKNVTATPQQFARALQRMACDALTEDAMTEPTAPDTAPLRDMDVAEWQELFRLRELVRARETALRRIVQTQSLPTAHEIARLTLHGLGA